MPERALIIVDVQNDFCPGGNLAVPDGHRVVPVINALSSRFALVAATKDWHPPDHVSLVSNHPGSEPMRTKEIDGNEQILWPDHCVQNTKGAELHPDLDLSKVHCILHKGHKQKLDSYSAFFENDHTTPTGLSFYLQGLGVREVYLTGLAEDVCVYATAKDARKLGFRVFIIADAVRGVDIPKGGLEEARKVMKGMGITYIGSDDVSAS